MKTQCLQVTNFSKKTHRWEIIISIQKFDTKVNKNSQYHNYHLKEII